MKELRRLQLVELKYQSLTKLFPTYEKERVGIKVSNLLSNYIYYNFHFN